MAGDAEPIVSNLPGSFPWSVLHDRHPLLLARVLDATPYPPAQRSAIEALAVEITGTIQPLTDSADDVATWQGWAAEHLGRSWYDVPFLWAENYFYRKLLAACGYLETGPWQGIDPFGPLKDAELTAAQVGHELAALDRLADLPTGERLDALVLSALWGNQSDLSFVVAAAADRAGKAVDAAAAGRARGMDGARGMDEARGVSAGAGQVDHLVVDDRPALRQLLERAAASAASGQGRGQAAGLIVLVADNAGRELLADLILIDHLLAISPEWTAMFHVKPRPYFVSDATPSDVLAAVNRLAAGSSGSAAVAIGGRLAAAIRDGRLAIRAHPFSVSPGTYHDLPADLGADFASATLTIMKGDLNYRRLVGDRTWPATTSFTQLTGYFPSPVVALRTVKSQVVVGLSESVSTALDTAGDTWRTSGEYALIQVRR